MMYTTSTASTGNATVIVSGPKQTWVFVAPDHWGQESREALERFCAVITERWRRQGQSLRGAA